MAPPPPPRRRFPRRAPGAAANRCRRPCGGSVVPAAGPGARRPRLASPGPRSSAAAGASRARSREGDAGCARRQELMSGGAAPAPAGRDGGDRAGPPPPRPGAAETWELLDPGTQRSGAAETRGPGDPGIRTARTTQTRDLIKPAPYKPEDSQTGTAETRTSNTLGLRDTSPNPPLTPAQLLRDLGLAIWDLTDLQGRPAQRPRGPHMPRAPSQVFRDTVLSPTPTPATGPCTGLETRTTA